MKINYLYKVMMIVQYIVKPVIVYKSKRYQIQCAAKYVELSMQLRKVFIYAIIGFFLMMLALVYSVVYFLILFPNEIHYAASIQFWLAIFALVSIMGLILTLCSQRFWIKLLKINEVLSYIEIDKDNNS